MLRIEGEGSYRRKVRPQNLPRQARDLSFLKEKDSFERGARHGFGANAQCKEDET